MSRSISKRIIRFLIYFFISIVIGFISFYVPVGKDRDNYCENTWYGFPLTVFYKSVQYNYEYIPTSMRIIKSAQAANIGNYGKIFAECGWTSDTEPRYVNLVANIAFYFIFFVIIDLTLSTIWKWNKQIKK